MKIESARWLYVDHLANEISRPGLARLSLIIDGLEAIIGTEQDMLRRGHDYVFVGGPWAETLPDIRLPATKEHNSVLMQGFTADPQVLKLTRHFLSAVQDGRFRPGQLPE